jgi:hypothetical protein
LISDLWISEISVNRETFEVLTAVLMAFQGFCDVTLCLWVRGPDVSKDVLDSLIFKVKTLRSFETSGTITSETQHNAPNELHVGCHTLFVGSSRKKSIILPVKDNLNLNLFSVKRLLMV